jgi:hypothetical protein
VSLNVSNVYSILLFVWQTRIEQRARKFAEQTLRSGPSMANVLNKGGETVLVEADEDAVVTDEQLDEELKKIGTLSLDEVGGDRSNPLARTAQAAGMGVTDVWGLLWWCSCVGLCVWWWYRCGRSSTST